MRLIAIALVLPATAFAQVDRRYAEEPTDGLTLPTTALAGEHDARSTVLNAGGLPLLRGPELTLALDLQDGAIATSSGAGFGLYAASSAGGGILPKLGWGIGLEWLRPARAQLLPDPGRPFRFTAGIALGLGPNAGLGLGWHHFVAEGALDGVDTFDVGLSTRLGAHAAFGANVRDIATAPIAGTPVQRRYEAELVIRPTGTDRLEVAAGGRLGETRLDVDAWGRFSARVARGTFVHGMFETRELQTFLDSPAGVREQQGRDYRATLGLELSFGKVGATMTATGIRDDARANHLLGGQLMLRLSGAGPASVTGRDDHIERVDLAGDIGTRELTNIVLRMRSIARDDSAKAVVVTFDGVAAGWASLEEIRNEIVNLRRVKKKVFAYMVSGTGRDYFIASAADKIYLDPAGGLRLVGMAGTTLYFRGVFSWLGVEPQFEKIAEYKSAPEQFTEPGPTETAAKMNNEMFDSLWERWLSAVGDARKLTRPELVALIDAGPYSAGELASRSNPNVAKLVDAVAAPDKVAQLVTQELGAVYAVSGPAIDRPDRWERPGVAVIYVDGDITDGASKSIPFIGRSLAGGETLVRAIQAARSDPRVGAIVLRIDSPGGSALASELVSREVFATRGVKPILCSFGDVAASGGYFIAAGCDLIYAEPMTVTGSIGIFYGKFDISGLLARVGVTHDTYKRGERSDAESMYRPYTDEERASLMEKLRYSYGRFVAAVAEGRGLTKEAVDAAGRGHVYTGEMAKPIKLVDRFGGLGDAIDEAKLRMGLDPTTKVSIIELPDLPSSLLGAVGSLLGARAEQTIELPALPGVRELVRGIPASVLAQPDVEHARMPYDFDFH